LRRRRSGVILRVRCESNLFRIGRRVSSSKSETSGRDAARHRLRTHLLLNADDPWKLDRLRSVEDLLKLDHLRTADAQLRKDSPLKPGDRQRVDRPRSVDAQPRGDGLLNADAPRLEDLSQVDHRLRHNDLSADGQQNDRNRLDRNQLNVRRQNSVMAHRHNVAVRLHVRPDRRRKRNA
jgi:hypothetical protein